MLQDRRCREWSSPVSLFLARASFNILVRIISIKFIYGTHHKLIGADDVTRYCGEADDVDNSSSALSASLIPLSPKVASSPIMGPQHYPRISRFRLIRRSLPLYDPGPSLCRLINRLLPSCSNHSRSIITSTSHRSNPSHAGYGTQLLDGYYLHYFTPSPPAHGYPPYQWPAYSG